MTFGEKIAKAIKKIKGKLIVSFILWLILVIVFVAPMGIAFKEAKTVLENGVWGDASWEKFFLTLGEYIVHPLQAMGLCIVGESQGNFFGILWKFSLIYLLAVIMGISKAIPKHEYDGIENGSSDWCTNGEQYKVLSNKEGIILAEKNYLPVDKRGNVNVLVVGRIWCW